MREIFLNGYIDEDVWFGDEITPGMLNDQLYCSGHDPKEDIRIILNSYGGNCNAATQMHDAIHHYPGKVHLVISGTAASAATVVAMAADRLEMTPGSLFMIHDPMLATYGNESTMEAAIDTLRACKNSILNMYMTRAKGSRDELAEMMKNTTWMDANEAFANGFVDGIMTNPTTGIENAAFIRTANLEEAQAKFTEWNDRHRPIIRSNADIQNRAEPQDEPEAELPAPEDIEPEGVPVELLLRQLDAIRYW